MGFEILVGYYIQQSISIADQFILLIQKNYNLQSINLEIARMGAEYRAKYNLKLPDALIIASSKYNKVEVLVSNDIKMQKTLPIKVLSVNKFIDEYKLSL